MNPFLPFVIAAGLAALAWTIVLFRIDPAHRRFIGLVGAWIATMVLAALWQADAVPWLWVFLKGVLLVWLGAIACLIIAAVSIWRLKEPHRQALLFCAGLSIVVNIAAGLQFLWLASVSPGGV